MIMQLHLTEHFELERDLLGLEMSSNFHHYLALKTVKMQYKQITGQLIPRVGVERKKIELEIKYVTIYCQSSLIELLAL